LSRLIAENHGIRESFIFEGLYFSLDQNLLLVFF